MNRNRQIGLDHAIETGTEHRPVDRLNVIDCLRIAAAIILVAVACWLTQLDDHEGQTSWGPSNSNERYQDY